MASVIGYVRVSTKGQADDGVSLDAQRLKIEQWAALNDHTITAIYADEGVSGAVTDRGGLNSALAAAQSGDVLVVYSFSRLSRDLHHTLSIAKQLKDGKIDLVSISERIDTTTAAGEMIFQMLAVLAAFERAQIKERTNLAIAHKRRNNEKLGGHVPYGKAVATNENGTKVLTANEAEQEIIKQVAELKAAGLSLRKISDELAERGFKSRTGKQFAPIQISRMLGYKSPIKKAA